MKNKEIKARFPIGSHAYCSTHSGTVAAYFKEGGDLYAVLRLDNTYEAKCPDLGYGGTCYVGYLVVHSSNLATELPEGSYAY